MESPTPILPWFPWPGRGWPSTAAQEAEFVAELERAVHILDEPLPNPLAVPRNLYTAVLNALRGGATLGDVRTLAPGTHLPSMLAAYRLLEDRLAEANASWLQIEEAVSGDDPGTLRTVIQANLLAAAKALPTPCERLLVAVTNSADPGLHTSARGVLKDVREACQLAVQVEARLAELGPLPYRDPRGVDLGRTLYNPYSSSVYTDPFYLPTRVAAIDSTRSRLFLADIADEFTDPDTDDLDIDE